MIVKNNNMKLLVKFISSDD